LRLCCRAPVAREARLACPCHGRNDPSLGIHSADPVVSSVGRDSDEEVASDIDRNGQGQIEARMGGGPPVSREPTLSRAGYRCNNSAGGIDAADPAVVRVGDKEIARGVDGDPTRRVKPRLGCRAAVAREGPPVEPGRAAPSHGRDKPCCGVDLADAVVVLVGDEQVSGPVEGNIGGAVKLRLGRRTAVARELTHPRAGHGRDDPGPGVHAADPAVEPVGDNEVARGVQRKARGSEKARVGRLAAVPREFLLACPSYGRDDPRPGVDAANSVVHGVRDEEVAGGVEGDPSR